MTSVESTDTVSTESKRRNRPGKNARQQAKGGNPSSVASTANPSQHSRAAQFASSSSSVPLPTPGKYPIVFPAGAGEPTRDVNFALDGQHLGVIAGGIPQSYLMNSKYAEFSRHADMTNDEFTQKLSVGFFLGVAQQIVHAHVNMGLPQGDFAPIFSSDVAIFSSVRSVISHLGEFPMEIFGTRYLLAGYAETVASLVRCADAISDGVTAELAGARMWLPTKAGDRNTKFIIAHSLARIIKQAGGEVDVSLLAAEVLSGSRVLWDKLKGLLGDPPAEGEVDVRNQFDFVFDTYTTETTFTTAFRSSGNRNAMSQLGLSWSNGRAADLKWAFSPKAAFALLSATHAQDRPSFAKFYSHATITANRTEVRGSPVQMSSVTMAMAVTIVKVAVAVTPGELSLLACFPLSGRFPLMAYNVTVTTSANVPQKATEFMQLDWL